ncbi:hypothetical protein OC834_002088 [Tilletia horrida]|nr:hypothetical protein OC834_002088 [Tilletia horrida]
MRVCSAAGLLPSAVASDDEDEDEASKVQDLDGVRLIDLAGLRTGANLFMLHCGGSLRNPLMSMMIKRRFHPNVLSAMLCGICETWAGVCVLLGGADVRFHRGEDEKMGRKEELLLRGVGEEALVCCAACWAACGGRVERDDQVFRGLVDAQVPASTPPPAFAATPSSTTKPRRRSTAATPAPTAKADTPATPAEEAETKPKRKRPKESEVKGKLRIVLDSNVLPGRDDDDDDDDDEEGGAQDVWEVISIL